MSLSPDVKTPQNHLEIIFAEGDASPALAPKKILLIGAKIGTAITATMAIDGSSGTEDRTTAAGVASLDVATLTTGTTHAATLTGRGSELHLAARAVFAQNPTATVYLAPLTPNGSSKALGTITPTVSGLTAGTLRVTVCGDSVDVPISASDTVSTIGLAVATAVNNKTDWPVTATNTWSTGAVVLRAKIIGPRGHAITFRCTLLDESHAVNAVNGTGVSNFGLTITMSGGTAVGGVYRLSGGGTSDDDVTALLASIAPTQYDRICLASYLVSGSSSANLALVLSQVGTQLNDARQFDQQVVCGTTDTVANSITLAAANAALMQMVALQGSDDMPLVLAGQMATARLYGDALAGGEIAGETTNPAENLNGLKLATAKAPWNPADGYEATEVESLLNHGVTPLVTDPSRPGRVRVVSSITSRSSSEGAPDFSVYKTYDVTVPQYVRAGVLASIRRTFRGKKIVDNSASGAPDPRPNVVQPRNIQSHVFGVLKQYEAQGIIDAVSEANVSAVRNTVNTRRVDIAFPCVPTQDLDTTAGQLRQRQPSLA